MTKRERINPRDSAPMATDVLTKKMGRFALAMAVARRAAHLIDRHGGSSNGATDTIERAVTDIASGRVKIVKEETPAQQAAQTTQTQEKRGTRKKAA